MDSFPWRYPFITRLTPITSTKETSTSYVTTRRAAFVKQYTLENALSKKITALTQYLGMLTVCYRHLGKDPIQEEEGLEFTWSLGKKELVTTDIPQEMFLTTMTLVTCYVDLGHAHIDKKSSNNFENAAGQFELAGQALDFARTIHSRHFQKDTWPSQTHYPAGEWSGRAKVLHLLAQECFVGRLLGQNDITWLNLGQALANEFQELVATTTVPSLLDTFAETHASYWIGKVAYGQGRLALDQLEGDTDPSIIISPEQRTTILHQVKQCFGVAQTELGEVINLLPELKKPDEGMVKKLRELWDTSKEAYKQVCETSGALQLASGLLDEVPTTSTTPTVLEAKFYPVIPDAFATTLNAKCTSFLNQVGGVDTLVEKVTVRDSGQSNTETRSPMTVEAVTYALTGLSNITLTPRELAIASLAKTHTDMRWMEWVPAGMHARGVNDLAEAKEAVEKMKKVLIE